MIHIEYMVKILILPIIQSNISIISCLFFSIGPLIIVMCSVKLLRFAFSQTSKQYLIMTFTVFFFKYDYRHATETFLIDYFFISLIFVKVSLCFHSSLMFKQINMWWLSVQVIFIWNSKRLLTSVKQEQFWGQMLLMIFIWLQDLPQQKNPTKAKK